MNTPTPDEITAALAVLRRVPSFNEHTTIGAIERGNTPLRWMARDLHELWTEKGLPAYPANIATEMEEVAARHGLRITADPDPGELVAYTEVRPRNDGPGWIPAMAGGWKPGDRDLASSGISAADRRLAAVYLLPEDGKA